MERCTKPKTLCNALFACVSSNLAAESDRLDDARIVDVEGERSGFVIKCVCAGGRAVLVCLGEGGFAVHLLDVLVALSDTESAEGADALPHDIVARYGEVARIARILRACDGAENAVFGVVEVEGDEAHAVAREVLALVVVRKSCADDSPAGISECGFARFQLILPARSRIIQNKCRLPIGHAVGRCCRRTEEDACGKQGGAEKAEKSCFHDNRSFVIVFIDAQGVPCHYVSRIATSAPSTASGHRSAAIG